MALKKSVKLFSEAQKVLVGGVNSPVRSFSAVGSDPIIAESAKGASIRDIDANSYTDYCLSWGALILGHAHRDVVAAVKKASSDGTSFGVTTRPEVEIARLIVKNIPSVDLVRFVNSGTEATMSAIRLSRGFTGRDMVVKFDGCYHGHFDDLLIKAGSGVSQLAASSSLGISKNHIQNTLSLPYNNADIAAEVIERHRDNIACVIVEPVAGNMGVVPPKTEFLKALREITRKNNIILIFDEIITGFRTNLGGVQSAVGIIPDITCLGKIIGGGFPVGAYGGRRDVMERLAPKGGVYQAGTFSGNPVVMTAGLATLKNLDRSFYSALNQKCEKFALAINGFFKKQNIDAFLSAYKSMMSIRFRPHPVFNYAQAQESASQARYARLFKYLLNEKIYFPPADLESFFISGAHSAEHLKRLQTTIESFFRKEKGR